MRKLWYIPLIGLIIYIVFRYDERKWGWDYEEKVYINLLVYNAICFVIGLILLFIALK